MSDRPEHISGTFYQNPDLYDLVFGFRVIPQQAEFVQSIAFALSGRKPQSVLDVGCGTGEHVLEFARRGLHSVGVDHSPEMIAHAVAKARTQGMDADFALADATALPFEGGFDCALSMFQSLPLLTTNAELTQALAGIGRALNPDGVLVIELGNPRDWLFDQPNGPREQWDRYCWSEQRGGARIRTQTWRDPINLCTETMRVEMLVDVAAPGYSVRLQQTEEQRLILPESFALLAESAGGLRVEAIHGDFSGRLIYDGSNRCGRMILVLRKPGVAKRPRRAGKGTAQRDLPVG